MTDNTELLPVTKAEIHVAHLQRIKDRTPAYCGDGPKPQFYQACHAALQAGIDAIASTTALQQRVAELEAENARLRPLAEKWRESRRRIAKIKSDFAFWENRHG